MKKTKVRVVKVSDLKLLKLWSELVKLRAGHKCEYPGCQTKTGLNSHHIFSKRHVATRYDTSNGLCLCIWHHTFGNFAAHRDPLFLEVIIKSKVRCRALIDKMAALRNIVTKNNNDFKTAAMEVLNQELNDLSSKR